MPHHGELLVAEVPHERDHIIGHRAFGGLSVLGRVGWERRLPVAAQVRTDDEERAGEQRRHPMPCRMRARMAVQQHHGRPLTAMPHAQGHLSQIDVIKSEAFKHEVLLPSAR